MRTLFIDDTRVIFFSEKHKGHTYRACCQAKCQVFDVKSCQVKSSQVKSSQVKSSQVKRRCEI